MQIIYSKAVSKFWATRYIKFVKRFGNTGGTVRHHFLPKAKDFWPEYTDLNEHSWNCILFTERQHFIAHWMLWKAFGGSQTSAFFAMKNKNGERLNSKTYEVLREEANKRISDLFSSEDFIKNSGQWEKFQETINDSDWQVTVNAVRKQKQSDTLNDSEWQSTVGIQKAEKQKATKSNPEWKETIGAEQQRKRVAAIDWKALGKKTSETLKSDDWKEKNYKTCEVCNKGPMPARNFARYHKNCAKPSIT